MTGRAVTLDAADGQRIAGTLWQPEAAAVPGVVLVPGSVHERDAYGQALPRLLGAHVAALALDIRGRGGSREPVPFHAMGPAQRAAVRLDVEAAAAYLARQPGIDAGRIAVVAEQDSADPAVLACASNGAVAGAALISGRLSAASKRALRALRAPVLCLVSKEDRHGLRDMVDAYLASPDRRSRLIVFEGIGFGTTMFGAWQFLHPQEAPIEQAVAEWLIGILGAGGQTR